MLRSKVDKFLSVSCISIMSILVVDVVWQVASRYLLSQPSSFTDELAGFLLIWVGLLGAAYVAGQNEHLAIDLLLQKSPPKRQHKIKLAISATVALFAISVLVIGGGWLMITRFQFDVKSAALSIPLGYVYSVLPISGILILYYALDDLVKEFVKK